MAPVHDGNQSYVCDICDFKLKHKASLIRHISVVHEEQKYFKCSKYNVQYTSKAIFLDHNQFMTKITQHLNAVYAIATLQKV